MTADIISVGSPTFQASLPATLNHIFDLLPQKAIVPNYVFVKDTDVI